MSVWRSLGLEVEVVSVICWWVQGHVNRSHLCQGSLGLSPVPRKLCSLFFSSVAVDTFSLGSFSLSSVLTINMECCQITIINLQVKIRLNWCGSLASGVILLYDSARHHLASAHKAEASWIWLGILQQPSPLPIKKGQDLSLHFVVSVSLAHWEARNLTLMMSVLLMIAA